MKESIYRRTLKAARDAADGETPTLLQVVATPTLSYTYALEFSSEDGAVVLAQGHNANTLIEQAVKADPETIEQAANKMHELRAACFTNGGPQS